MKPARLLSACAFALLCSCDGSLIGAPAASDRTSVFDDLWHQVDLHYSFFVLKRINWDSLGAVYRPLAVNATTDASLADVLARMLAELADVHVALTPTGSSTRRYQAKFEFAPTFFDASRVPSPTGSNCHRMSKSPPASDTSPCRASSAADGRTKWMRRLPRSPARRE